MLDSAACFSIPLGLLWPLASSFSLDLQNLIPSHILGERWEVLSQCPHDLRRVIQIAPNASRISIAAALALSSQLILGFKHVLLQPRIVLSIHAHAWLCGLTSSVERTQIL